MRKKIIITLIFLLITFLYFSFLPIITPDSSSYYSYIDIITGKLTLSEWNPIRGPSMPLVIYLIIFIFGDNVYGFLIGTFVFYLILLFFGYKIIKQVTDIYKEKIINLILWFSYILLIVFNPLIIGYYHPILTEFVATTISLISCFMAYKWINKEYEKNLLSFMFYIIIFCLLSVFMWFLKQPYISVVIFPLFISTILSIIKIRNIKNILSKIFAFILCIIVVLLSIKIWNKILINNGVKSSSSINEGFLSKGMVSGISNYRLITTKKNNNIKFIKLDKYLSKNNKDQIIEIINGKSKYKGFKLYKVLNIKGNKIIDKEVLFQEDIGTISLKESGKFVVKALFKHPILFIDSYLSNYLATVNIYTSYTADYKYYYPIKTLKDSWNENKSLGLVIYENRPIYWWAWSDDAIKVKNMVQYEVENKPNKIAKGIMAPTINLNLLLFKLVFLFTPILFVYFIIRYLLIFIKKKDTYFVPLYEILIILFGFGFFHVLLHAITCAIIDRYAFVAYPAVLIATILLLKLRKPVIKNKLEGNNNIHNNKVIFVIPAYNEEKSVGKVIDEIKKIMPNTDIVVINDCSSDNTAIVVKDKGVKCITLPFNLGYAMAVQTGIKYAFENDYDYVIQFDADGQHIAGEAKRLLNKIKETECDIIIGSRFLKKNNYKHGFFRKMGTKMFSFMILLLCEKKITDPTSGFQCLNKRVIKRYSKMGNYPEYPDANLIIEMLMEDYKIIEIPVKMRVRKNGESMHGGIIKPIKYMVKTFYIIIIILIRNIGYKRK